MSGRPQVRWRDQLTRRERTRTFSKAADAKAFKTKIEYELPRGTYVDPPGAKTSLADWVDQWRESWLHLRQNTILQRESLLRTHALPYFGDISLGQVTQAHVQSWVIA